MCFSFRKERLVVRITFFTLTALNFFIQEDSTNISSVDVIGQNWQAYLTYCWSLLWWEYQVVSETKLLSADVTVTKIVKRILNQCYYVEIMWLPQKISNISIAHDYEAIILYLATTATLAKVHASNWVAVIQISSNSLQSSCSHGL